MSLFSTSLNSLLNTLKEGTKNLNFTPLLMHLTRSLTYLLQSILAGSLESATSTSLSAFTASLTELESMAPWLSMIII